jgi:hypothetical protein
MESPYCQYKEYDHHHHYMHPSKHERRRNQSASSLLFLYLLFDTVRNSDQKKLGPLIFGLLIEIIEDEELIEVYSGRTSQSIAFGTSPYLSIESTFLGFASERIRKRFSCSGARYSFFVGCCGCGAFFCDRF